MISDFRKAAPEGEVLGSFLSVFVVLLVLIYSNNKVVKNTSSFNFSPVFCPSSDRVERMILFHNKAFIN